MNPSRVMVTLDIIRERCNEEGECWLWSQGHNSAGHPVVRHDGETRLVRRVAAKLAGKDIDGKLLRATCRNSGCCNPAHLVPTSRSKISRDTHAAADEGMRVSRAAACRRSVVLRGVAKLNPAIVAALKLRPETDTEIAREMGLHPKTINDARNGRTWRTAAPNSSVFNQRA